MQIYLITFAEICEECEHIRAYIDPIVAAEQCELLNKKYHEDHPEPYYRDKWPYVVSEAIEVVE